MIDPGSILTYSGRRFYPLDPRPEDVDPIDIAHSLSNQCRYTGHTKFHYSVATHSVLIFDYLKKQGHDDSVLAQAILHDGGEAYLLDLAAPLKHHPEGFGERFCKVEDAIEKVIAQRFGLDYPYDPVVKDIDIQLRETEMDQLFPRDAERNHYGEKLPIFIPRWSPAEGKINFLFRLAELGIVDRGPTGTEQFKATERKLVAV